MGIKNRCKNYLLRHPEFISELLRNKHILKILKQVQNDPYGFTPVLIIISIPLLGYCGSELRLHDSEG